MDRSWSWASQRNLVRTNPVHGEEEARLVLEDWFANENEEGTSTNAAGSGTFEDLSVL